MKQRKKRYGIQFVKEIIPVVVGILIALFIDNWNSQRKDKAYIKQVYTTISTELSESKEDIKEMIPKQEALIAGLEENSKNKEVTIQKIVMDSKGIYIPQVKINGWKAISSTKIDLMDYNRVNTLSNIAELKEMINNKSEFLMTYLYSNINSTDENTKQTFKMILLDIMQTENTMLQLIEYFEKEDKEK